jgi:hypothetical protein
MDRLSLPATDGDAFVIDAIPAPVVILTPAGAVAGANARMLAYLGRPLEDLRRWHHNDLVHPEDLLRVRAHSAAATTAGEPHAYEVRLRRADGAYCWFQLRARPLRDAAGEIVRWVLLLVEIDEFKSAQEASRASGDALQQIIETMPALAWSAHPDGSAEFFNRHYLEYIGLSAEQARGWGWPAAVHREDLAGSTAAWKRILASQRPGEAEVRLRRHDGAYRWFLLRARPLRDGQGRVLKWYGIATDIEDRKHAEEELRRSEAFLNQAQRLTRTGSLWWKVSTGEIEWSEESYRLLDYPRKVTPTVERIMARCHPDDLPLLQDVVRQAAGGAPSLEYEHRVLAPGGGVKYLHVVLQNVGRDADRPEYLGALTDITQRKEAEADLLRAREELAHVTRVSTLSTLTASIAHEVNQPLSGIITNASTCLRLLDADPPNVEVARETARRTIRDGRRAADVVTRLRELFAKKELALEPLDLNEATREVVALTSTWLRSNRVLLRMELAEHLPQVAGDRVQLQQVVLNLLRNASDAMAGIHDRPRQLLVRTEQEGDAVRLLVRDTGIGLPPEGAARLFDAFYTNKSGGMGIGLSVSRSIIERHHGRLVAQPNEGPGATFVFSIPVARAAQG